MKKLLMITLLAVTLTACKKNTPVVSSSGGLLVSKITTINNGTDTLVSNYTYDSKNNMTGFTTGTTKATASFYTFTYDGQNNLVQIQQGTSADTINYKIVYLNNQPSSITSNGLSGTFTVTGNKVTAFTGTNDYQYVYSGNNLIVSKGRILLSDIRGEKLYLTTTDTLQYNKHKSPFYSCGNKWQFPVYAPCGGENECMENDQTTSNGQSAVTKNTSTYNAQDYPVHTTQTQITNYHGVNTGSSSDITYEYIPAK